MPPFQCPAFQNPTSANNHNLLSELLSRAQKPLKLASTWKAWLESVNLLSYRASGTRRSAAGILYTQHFRLRLWGSEATEVQTSVSVISPSVSLAGPKDRSLK